MKSFKWWREKGLNKFIDKGCTSCHNGIALGGTMQPFQVAAQYKFTNVGDFKGDSNGMEVNTNFLRNITWNSSIFP